MNCPDCKIPMEKLMVMSSGDYLNDDIWKCPKCKIEIEVEQEESDDK